MLSTLSCLADKFEGYRRVSYGASYHRLLAMVNGSVTNSFLPDFKKDLWRLHLGHACDYDALKACICSLRIDQTDFLSEECKCMVYSCLNHFRLGEIKK